MEKLSLHITRFLIFILALQIINLGLFAQDFEPLSVSPYNTEANLIHSVDEYVVSAIFHQKSSIPKSKHHHKDFQSHKHSTFKLVSIPRPQAVSSLQLVYHNKPTTIAAVYHYQFCKEINPPPPKFSSLSFL